jgi:AraC-like DNA-binding protein
MKKKEQIEIVRNPNLPYINHEIKFPIGNTVQSAFMQYGFYNQTVNRQVVHTHSYTEIHAFIGEATVYIDDIAYSLNGSNIVLIPKQTYHTYFQNPDTIHAAFQVKFDANFQVMTAPESILREFFEGIDYSRESGDYSSVVPYMSFICSYFFKSEAPLTASKVTDYAFLINEFFSLKYIYDVKLTDLARELCVSDKQAHRLVVKHTGKNFSEELTLRRMHAAEHLIKDGRLSNSEVAETVGYQTYSGFWKAYKKFKESK